MANFDSNNYSDNAKQRILAVGGIHIFESQTPCQLVRAEPEGALKDLAWVDTLALEATSEGDAEVTCGSERIPLKMVTPARLEITLSDEGNPTNIPVNEPFKVQARLYDNQGRELEVGKFTNFEWTPSEILKVANDPSAGEFGFCDTCFGMHGFRAIKPGKGLIAARLGSLEGNLTIETKPS